MKYKPLIACFAALFFLQSLYAQHDTKTNAYDKFCLEYKMYPIEFLKINIRMRRFIVHGTHFIYSKGNWTFETGNLKDDTIITGTLSVRDVRRMTNAVKNYKDTVLTKIDPCILSGVECQLNVLSNNSFTEFYMRNIFHPTAAKVIRIMNKYLPKQEQVDVRNRYLKEEKDCLKLLGRH